MIVASSADHPCELHKAHRPANLTVEFHHVIPVAWQLHTPNPSARPSPGPDQDGRGMLWDNRGVWICPTGHRNVHHWIVVLMHALNANPDAAIPGAWKTAVPAGVKRGTEAQTALLGLQRAASCSVDFAALAAAGEWGQV